MKKLILSITLLSWGFTSNAQVVCAVQSPTNIAGNYTFTWADPAGGWGTPDFLIPNTFVEDTLVLVNDGTPGTNATYGNLLAEESCNPSPANAYAGKIAVLRRNTCEFGVKALNAQNAGAVAVIVVNREPSVLDMGAGAQGANVTIPVIMLSSTDGQLLIDQMLNGPVVAFIGNKTGLFADDAGITKGATLIAKSVGVPSQLAQNGSEFNFEIGTRVYNYGTSPQNNVTVTAEVTDPTGMTVYNQSVSLSNMPSGDSIDIFPGGTFSFPQFSLPTYTPGRYTLTYNVDLGTPDEYDADNSISSDFVINDNVYTYAQIDTVTGLPVSNAHYRPSTNNSTFSTCMVINDPNASRIAVTGIYFSATTASTVSIEGEEIALSLYRWEDVFTDLNDAALDFLALNAVASGFYNYPNDSTTAAALQGDMVYGAFSTPFVLEDGQRFLACAQTVNTSVYLGHDSKTNYLWNEGLYLQPLTPNESDAAYFASGFGMDIPSSMGLSIVNAAEVGIPENAIEGIAFPNPAKDKVTISMNTNGDAQLIVTDIAGKIAMTKNISLENGKTVISINDLDAGMYIFNVQLENGKSSQFQVVKK